MRCVLRAWQYNAHELAGMDRRDATRLLRRKTKEIYRDENPYGFAIITTIMLVFLTSTLSWVIGKFLDWVWDRRHEPLPVEIGEFDR